ncbi:MAG: protein jag [Defluviitaleaceae bacterium]|nr:protein jag [Defluviitaleaceae bacterium]
MEKFDKIEVSAKTEESAIAEALASLGATKDEVVITLLDPGSKGGLFGFGSKPVKISVTRKKSPADVAKEFLKEVTLAMGLSVSLEVRTWDRQININMSGDNMGLLIGKRGHTLDALQYLVNLAVNQNADASISVVLDTENYRKRRRETLESLAYGIARKVKSTKKSVTLEPMSRFERHIIHTALQNDRFVRTTSEGSEPYRYVVVNPK